MFLTLVLIPKCTTMIYKTLRRKLKIEHYKSNYMCSGMVRGSCLASGVTLVTKPAISHE